MGATQNSEELTRSVKTKPRHLPGNDLGFVVKLEGAPAPRFAHFFPTLRIAGQATNRIRQ